MKNPSRGYHDEGPMSWTVTLYLCGDLRLRKRHFLVLEYVSGGAKCPNLELEVIEIVNT